MHLFKRAFSLLLVLCLMFSVSISALAADYTASNYGELETAFGDSSGEDVNIDVTADINFEGNVLSAGKDITYTIGSQNGSALVNSSFDGSGDVTINTAVKGDGSAALSTNGDVSVTVTGDITSNSAGVTANDESRITVDKGNIDAAETALTAGDKSQVTVFGNVSGGDGSPDDVIFSDPSDYSDGHKGVHAYGDAIVFIDGNVSGGDGYGTYAYAAEGIVATERSSVTVTGNVTGGSVIADPKTSDASYRSVAGNGITMFESSNVTVNGNVSGGSTNGAFGSGGYGIHLGSCTDKASVTVAGSVTGGKASAEGGTNGYGIDLIAPITPPGPSAPPSPPSEIVLPKVSVGSVDSVGSNLSEEEYKAFLESIGLIVSSGEAYAEPRPMEDHFWDQVARQIRASEKGDELSINAAHRSTMPTYILDLVAEYEVTLIVQWNGGEDIVIEGPVEVYSDIIWLSSLRELL